MARHSNVVEFSSENKFLLQVMMVLTAGLLRGRNAYLVGASASANEHSFQWLLSTPAAEATSENYLLASSMPTSYGFNWPTPSSQRMGTNADHLNNSNDLSVRVSEPNGEIETEAIWAKTDVTESANLVEFEKESITFYSVMPSGRRSRDTLACVGYVSCSKPFQKYPRYDEYSVGWII